MSTKTTTCHPPQQILMVHDDDSDDEDDDPEDWTDEAASEDIDESETIACPNCGRQVYEDAAYCPHCDHDFADPDANPQRKPLWIILGSLACMYAFYRWITLR